MTSTNFANHFKGYPVTATRFITSSRLFGTCASWMFSSFIIVQAFTYLRHYKKDSKFLKAIVYVVILLQLVQTGLESYEAYATDSVGWGDPEIIFNLSIAIADDLLPILISLTAFIIQYFFIWRIWTFSTTFTLRSTRILFKLVCAIIALVSALSLAAGLTGAIVSLSADAQLPKWLKMIVVLWNASSAATDITITICMMGLLLHARANTCFGETRDLLSRLTRILLQTGLLTSVLALLVLPLLLIRNLVGIYSLPWFVLGKSYVISLLANLNARKRSNVSVVHGSDNDQAIPQVTKMSTIIFSPQNHRIEEEDNVASDVSVPISFTDVESQPGCQPMTNLNVNMSRKSEEGAEINSPFNAI